MKTHQVFSVHNTSVKFENSTIDDHFGFFFLLRKTRTRKCHDNRDFMTLEKLRFQNVFCSRQNGKPAFINSFSMKSVFEKLRNLRDGLVWTVGLTVEIKLCSQIPPA